jgi:hypothetical protein
MTKVTKGQGDKNSVWLDEVGLHLSLPRFENESISEYRQRLLLQARRPPAADELGLIRSINRVVGALEKDIFEITLVLNAQGQSIAPDARIEVDSCFLRIWSDYENSPPELELDIFNRDGAYFLKDVFAEMSSLPFIDIEILAEDWEYLKSYNLVYGNTERYITESLLKPSKFNKLIEGNIRDISFYNPILYRNEVLSVEDIKSYGDFYIDYDRGYVHSYELSIGGVAYTYREFPYRLSWQPVSIIPVNDKSLNHMTKDYLINKDGVSERLLLNSYGAKITNEILQIHPLQWGR